eukprot:5898493-Karenia_brevis.AAC.1
MTRAARPLFVPQSTLLPLGVPHDCIETLTVLHAWLVCMSLQTLDIHGDVHSRQDQPRHSAK